MRISDWSSDVCSSDLQIAAGLDLDTALPEEREGTLYLNTDLLNDFNLGGIKVAAANSITVDNGLAVAPGGDIILYGPQVDVNFDLTARSGSIHLGNVLNQEIGRASCRESVCQDV